MPILTEGPMLEPQTKGVDEFHVGLGTSLRASLSETLSDLPTSQLFGAAEVERAKGNDIDFGEIGTGMPTPGFAEEQARAAAAPRIDIIDANDQVKKAGLAGHLKLPDQPDIPQGQLEIMMQRARDRRERETTMERGPQGFIPSTLQVGTSFLVGAVDPINIASAFIPVVGELRYGKMLAAAGDSFAARMAVRAGVGGAQGVVGQAALEPLDWWSHTQDGRDFGMSDVLHNLMFGAVLGGTLHAGGGAVSDIYRVRKERPLYPYDIGEPLEYHTPWEDLRTRPAAPAPLLGEFPGVHEPIFPEDPAAAHVTPAALAAEAAAARPQVASAEVQAIDNLPPRAREDATRGSIASLIEGEPVRVGEMLDAAAHDDPRIADALTPLSAPAAREAVFDDIHQKLLAVGMDEDEAGYNAALIAARYATRAERLGGQAGNALDLYRAEGIDVRRGMLGEEPVAGRAFQQPAMVDGIRVDFPDRDHIALFDLGRRLAEGERVDEAEAQRLFERFKGFMITDPLYDSHFRHAADLREAARDYYDDVAEQVRRGRPFVAGDVIEPDLKADWYRRALDEATVEALPARAKQLQLFQSRPTAPTFYSAVDRAIGAAKQDKATAEQWLGILKNAAGVKPEELRWLGLEDWLKEQTGSLTRDQVQAYVRANQIEVNEVHKGGAALPSDIGQWTRGQTEAIEDGVTRTPLTFPGIAEHGTGIDVYHNAAGEVTGYSAFWQGALLSHGEHPTFEAAVRDLADAIGEDVGGTQYASYSLPGGENYRELLLTLPHTPRDRVSPTDRAAAPYMERWNAINAEIEALRENEREARFQRGADNDLSRRVAALEAEREQLHQQMVDDTIAQSGGRLGGDAFKTSHWEEPNVLAHIRFDDRVSDGKKTLHVAEVQSDWHQAGRRRGYDSAEFREQQKQARDRYEAARVAVIERTKQLWRDATGGKYESLGEARDGLDPTDAMYARGEVNRRIDFDKELARLTAERKEAELAMREVRNAVPDAPFKTTWPELAMKRMIRYAAEHGYERISWDTGATNAERYDLSKQIKSLRWNETRGDLQARDHDGEIVIQRRATRSELPDIIGKEATQRLLEQKPVEVKLLPEVHREYLTVAQTEHQYVVTNVDGREVKIGKGTVGSEAEAKEYAERYLNNSAKEINTRRELEGQRVGSHRVLEGLDLKVGGEGMAGFYDKILPATVSKLVKKFGARVEAANIGTPDKFTTHHFIGDEPTKEQIAQVAEAIHARPTDQRFVSPVTGERQEYQINRASNEMAFRAVRQAMNDGQSFTEAMTAHGNSNLAELFGGRIEVRQNLENRGAPVHAVDITPELRKAAVEQGFPLFQGGEEPRGRITLSDNRAVIDLFKSADKSTFLHETGHLWLDELMRDAARAGAPEQLRADRVAVLDWLGVKDAADIGVAEHEKWAEGFEHYLATAESPSNALARAFEQFRQWMLDVYHAVTGLKQRVSPEVRAVMDRLIATDREIAERRGAAAAAAVPEKLGGAPEPLGDVVTKHVAPKAARGRAAADPQTWSLFEYLASRGGLKPDPELEAIFGNARGPFVPGFGPLVRKTGMPLDEALRSAKDGRYFFDAGDVTGAEAKLTPRDLLDRIDDENRKKKVYRVDRGDAAEAGQRAIDREEEAKHILDALYDEVEASTGQKGVEIDAALANRVVEIVQKEGERDVLAAYERAIMEDAERYEGLSHVRREDQATTHLPGWDAADAGTAPGDGAPDPRPRRQGRLSDQGESRADGGQPRGGGDGDRAPAPDALAAAADRDAAWRALAHATPDFDAPAIVAASKAADDVPLPPTKLDERLTAAQKADAYAKQMYDMFADRLPPEERQRLDDLIKTIDSDHEAREIAIQRGAACLFGAR